MSPSRVFIFFVLAAACFAQSRDNEFNKLADRIFDELIFRYDAWAKLFDHRQLLSHDARFSLLRRL
jgi:hypothetical protein